jgi:SAM-dependent methyltransferase
MSDHTATLNSAVWNRKNEEFADAAAATAWSETEITWGLFANAERELNIIGAVAGLDVIELGCGTAYFSSWLARRGARPVGVDVSSAQLATARRCQLQHQLDFPLIEANAERVPLPDASFDLALSEYGACLWCEPELFVSEAARLLRPGGRLVFLTNSVLLALCVPELGSAGPQLLRAQREIARLAWPNEGVEFHLGHGEWIALLAKHGLRVERMVELYAGSKLSSDSPHYDFVSPEWAAKWPCEEIWVARRHEIVEGRSCRCCCARSRAYRCPVDSRTDLLDSCS